MSTRGNQFTSFAEDNFSRSGASGLYDSARPNYPTPAIEKILSLVAPASGSTVVELGAGTGIFTRGLVQVASSTPAHQGRISKVVAVEPSEGMREGFNAKLEKVHGIDVSIQDGLFDKIPAEDSSVDLVLAAQAFHWVGHDGESALSEIARVLKPDGVLALIWNLEDRSAPWVAQLRDAYEKYEGDTPQYRLGYWKSIFESKTYADHFQKAEYEQFTRSIPTNKEGVVNRVLSKSYITALSDKEQEALAGVLRETVDRGDGRKWIDEGAGTFEYPYTTDLYVIRKQ